MVDSMFSIGKGDVLNIKPRVVEGYQWEDIGIENCQYFPGRGVAHTPYDSVYVGVCDDWFSAAEDCIEQAGEDGWAVEGIILPAWGDDEHIKKTSVLAYLMKGGLLDIDVDGYPIVGETDLYYHVALFIEGDRGRISRGDQDGK